MKKSITVAAIAFAVTLATATEALAYRWYDYSLGDDAVIWFTGPDGNFIALPTGKQCSGDQYNFWDLYSSLQRNGSSTGSLLIQTFPCRGNIITVCIADPDGMARDKCVTVRKR